MKPVYLIKKLESLDWSAVQPVSLAHTGWLKQNAVEARAQLCLIEDELWVRMEAKEAPIRATLTSVLDQVCDDSCLEFFLAIRVEDTRYFNFEFNPLGTLNLGFGGERASRVRQIIKNPEKTFSPRPFLKENGWGIEFKIPASFLKIYELSFNFGGEMHGNFYKCGDMTEVPHYLAWAPLSCETPDYHRREDFGILRFEEQNNK